MATCGQSLKHCIFSPQRLQSSHNHIKYSCSKDSQNFLYCTYFESFIHNNTLLRAKEFNIYPLHNVNFSKETKKSPRLALISHKCHASKIIRNINLQISTLSGDKSTNIQHFSGDKTTNFQHFSGDNLYSASIFLCIIILFYQRFGISSSQTIDSPLIMLKINMI